MNTKNLRDLLLDQLADMYYAEKQLLKALPKVAKAANHEGLRAAIEDHLDETGAHAQMLEGVFRNLGETPKAKKCHAILGILKEGEEMMDEYKGSPALDAVIIAAAQKVEHYEITTYGCLLEWAMQLDNPSAAAVFEAILDQEKETDTELTKLAREVMHESAAEDAAGGTMAVEEESEDHSTLALSTSR